MSILGGCLCGSVRYEIDGEFLMAGNCHCTVCRRWSGAAFSSWAFVKPEQFRWTSGENLLEAFESSPGQRRCFCRHCGSSLVATHDGVVGEVLLGSVDGDPGVRPAEHIFTGSKASWHEITDDNPQHAGWPPGFQGPAS